MCRDFFMLVSSWRRRICALALGLSMYLTVFALYSISVSGSDIFGGDASSAVALAGPVAPSSGLPRRHPSNRGPRIVHPRNLQVSPI